MMNSSLTGYDYGHEDGITWLEPAGAFQYVREALVICRFRARQPHAAPDTRLVAYATLRPDARPERTHRFLRRAWYAIPDGGFGPPPPDAVDPRSVHAGQASVRARESSLTVAADARGPLPDAATPTMPTTEPEAPGTAFRVKRLSVPRDPLAAAAALRRHFSPDELLQLTMALSRPVTAVEQRQTA